MKYGKVIFKGGNFKIAICNYPSTVRSGIAEYAIIKPGKGEYQEVVTFLAEDDDAACDKGLSLAKEYNLE